MFLHSVGLCTHYAKFPIYQHLYIRVHFCVGVRGFIMKGFVFSDINKNCIPLKKNRAERSAPDKKG